MNDVSNNTPTSEDEDDHLDAVESLALVDAQRREVRTQLDADFTKIYAAWGLAWALGMGLAYLVLLGAIPVSTNTAFLPFFVLGILAVVVTVGTVTRAERGLRRAHGHGARFGAVWALPFAVVGLFAARAPAHGFEIEHVGLVIGILSSLIVAVIYLVQGALEHISTMYWIGVMLIVAVAVGIIVGGDEFVLVQATVGGAAFLVGAGYNHRARTTIGGTQ